MSQQRWGTTRVPSGVLAAIGGAALAVWLFGVPLGTVLLVGLFLICPLMMAGTHGSGHGPKDAFRESTGRTERAPGKTDAPHRRGAEPRDGN